MTVTLDNLLLGHTGRPLILNLRNNGEFGTDLDDSMLNTLQALELANFMFLSYA